jgi:hypothetical protein
MRGGRDRRLDPPGAGPGIEDMSYSMACMDAVACRPSVVG